MRLLLDTHALVWWLTDSSSLSPRAKAAVANPSNKVWASAVSGYELVNKQRLGKLDPPVAAELALMLRRAALPAMAISLEHAIAAAALPGPHRDPWDRLLMAQARLGELTLVSVDPVFREYGTATLW
ncbi:MAG: type II toxin-antitoxin system VapC family toxin [Geminicoccaceae bacterium]